MDEGHESDMTHALGLLQAALERAQTTLMSLLSSIVTDNARYISELEAALTDAEAALSME